MRLNWFPMVLLIGILCVASRASAQKVAHGAADSVDGARRSAGIAPDVGGDHRAAQNDDGRPGGRVESKKRSDTGNIDRVPQGAARNDGRHLGDAVNNLPHRAGAALNNPPSVGARGGSNANIAGQNAWRYRQHNNRWWYWTPNNSWVYWNNGVWVPYGALASGGPRNYGGRYPYSSGYRGTVASAGGYLGVTFDQRFTNRAVISQVNDNSPAAQAGLQPGDAIRAINGESIQSPYQPTTLISRFAPRTEISLTIERDRQTSNVSVILGQR